MHTQCLCATNLTIPLVYESHVHLLTPYKRLFIINSIWIILDSDFCDYLCKVQMSSCLLYLVLFINSVL